MREDINMERIEGWLSELESLGNMAKMLWHEANGDGFPPVHEGEWVEKTAMPYLDAVSGRLPDLASFFRRILWKVC